MLAKLSRRWSEPALKHNWFAVIIDFAIVVLGVFVGIQAANWNEARKNRVEESRYYTQIIGDLRTDQTTLLQAQQRSADFDTAAETTLMAMKTGKLPEMSPGAFAVGIHHAGYLYIPHASRQSYDELISTGNLGLLRNEAAKRAIATYYSDFDDSRQWDGLLRSQQDRYWDATSGVLPRSVLRDAIEFREPNLTRGEAVQILINLRKRDRVEDMLVSMAAHQERVRRDSKMLAESGQALIRQLEPLASR